MTTDNNSSAQTTRISARIQQRSARSRKKYLVAAVFLLIALVAGGAIGSALTIFFIGNRMHRIPQRPDALGKSIVDDMSGVITLDDKERATIDSIVTSRMQIIANIRESSWEAIGKEFESMNQEVGKILGAERDKVWQEKCRHFRNLRRPKPDRMSPHDNRQ